MKKIIEECRKKMYEAIWQELDRDPQRPAVARVDVKSSNRTFMELKSKKEGDCSQEETF